MTNKTNTIQVIRAVWYADPAEGWLQVPVEAVRFLGIEDRITTDSRIDGKDAYLHEDNDVALLRSEARAQGIPLIEASKVEFTNPSPVRHMARFQPYWAAERKPETGDLFTTADGREVELVEVYRETETSPEVMIVSVSDDPWEGMLQVPGGDAARRLFPIIEPPAPSMRP